MFILFYPFCKPLLNSAALWTTGMWETQRSESICMALSMHWVRPSLMYMSGDGYWPILHCFTSVFPFALFLLPNLMLRCWCWDTGCPISCPSPKFPTIISPHRRRNLEWDSRAHGSVPADAALFIASPMSFLGVLLAVFSYICAQPSFRHIPLNLRLHKSMKQCEMYRAEMETHCVLFCFVCFVLFVFEPTNASTFLYVTYL